MTPEEPRWKARPMTPSTSPQPPPGGPPNPLFLLNPRAPAPAVPANPPLVTPSSPQPTHVPVARRTDGAWQTPTDEPFSPFAPPASGSANALHAAAAAQHVIPPVIPPASNNPLPPRRPVGSPTCPRLMAWTIRAHFHSSSCPPPPPPHRRQSPGGTGRDSSAASSYCSTSSASAAVARIAPRRQALPQNRRQRSLRRHRPLRRQRPHRLQTSRPPSPTARTSSEPTFCPIPMRQQHQLLGSVCAPGHG